jgi:thiol-disulfide isomerase/thioredoxin
MTFETSKSETPEQHFSDVGRLLAKARALDKIFVVEAMSPSRTRLSNLSRWAAKIPMAMNDVYAAAEPSRASIDMMDGPAVIEFGSPWCGHCRAAQPLLASAFADHPRVRHIKIADGSGRPLAAPSV